MSNRPLALLVVAVAGAATLALANTSNDRTPSGVAPPPAVAPPPQALPPTAKATAPPAVADLPVCSVDAPTAVADAADPRIRAAAQRGLDFVSASMVAWQDNHQCYGCHVQGVTMTAMAVGKDSQYAIDDKHLKAAIDGLTIIKDGSRSPHGLGHNGGHYKSASKSLGGMAFARFDQLVGRSLAEDLLATAQELLEIQGDDGAIINDYTHAPVAVGPIQDTVLAMQTWNQAYARSADVRWVTAVGKAEDWLRKQALPWTDSPPAQLQLLNYAILGLVASESTSGEGLIRSLTAELVARQHEDGGWGLQASGASSAYATGQALYVLRTLGRDDTDPVVTRGTDYLISHQQVGGGWGSGGAERAEAMWAVLGLVSVDVLSLEVTGISEGMHVDDAVALTARAIDNTGGTPTQVEFAVDDVVIDRECGDALSHSWQTATLAPGPHVVDVTATSSTGETARRRYTVYAGPVYLTRLGTAWDDGGTRITARDIAPEGTEHSVRLTVEGVGGAAVYTSTIPGRQGPIGFWWNGKTDAGSTAKGKRFDAKLEYLDPAGTVLQVERIDFVHETLHAQREQYGQIQGQLALDGAEGANTRVELLDALGNVVGSTLTTRSGSYRFRNVDAGKYKVRVAKDGWGDAEQEVEAAPAEESKADLDLRAR